ncbi:MAG: TRAP transporter substrate-binding protein DctP [Acetobacteraceae bacterium]
MNRRTLLTGAAATLALPAISTRAADAIKMRISIEVAATHKRTALITKYAEEVNKLSGGRINAEVFHSAQLFRDRDVAKALRQGGAEMATPGPWNLTGLVRNLELPLAPIFYGRDPKQVHQVLDGPVGQELNAETEKRIGVKILGKWLDLGASHSFSTERPLNGPADLKGLKIRTSGGAGQMIRVKFFGGIPNLTSWPDVPLALSQGTFDALFTTNESLASAKLWESGVRYGLQDYQFFAQYMPMVSGSFWSKLTPDLQKIVTGVWQEHIESMRDAMAQAQAHALETMQQQGVKVVIPSAAVIADTRKRLLTTQDEATKELGIDPALMARTTAAFNALR